jgi:hypothetical protein
MRIPVIYSIEDLAGKRKWYLGYQYPDGIHRSGNDPSWSEEEVALLFKLRGVQPPAIDCTQKGCSTDED